MTVARGINSKPSLILLIKFKQKRRTGLRPQHLLLHAGWTGHCLSFEKSTPCHRRMYVVMTVPLLLAACLSFVWYCLGVVIMLSCCWCLFICYSFYHLAVLLARETVYPSWIITLTDCLPTCLISLFTPPPVFLHIYYLAAIFTVTAVSLPYLLCYRSHYITHLYYYIFSLPIILSSYQNLGVDNSSCILR